MTRADDLRALLARTRQATGSDRFLDASLAALHSPWLLGSEYRQPTLGKWVEVGCDDHVIYAASYTTSVDSVLHMIGDLAPGWHGRVSFGAVSTARLWHGERADKIQAQDGASPALALIAALLSALISQEAEQPAPWPAGCIKPSACARHYGCMYAQSAERCRHFGRDLRDEVEAAQAPAPTQQTGEGQR